MKTLLVIFPFLFMLLGFTGCDKMDPQPPAEPSSTIHLYIKDKEGNDLLQQLDLLDYGKVSVYHQANISCNGEASASFALQIQENQGGLRFITLDTSQLWEWWRQYNQADTGTIDYTLEIPSFKPAALNLHIHLKWNAEYTSERDREITSYEDVTINGQPYEIESGGQIVYVVE